MNPELQGPEADKIRSMFGEIADGYDLANTVMSGGIHHSWRKSLVKWSGVKPGNYVLDCATGTGDLAIEFKAAVGSIGNVIGIDFCDEMLSLARAKAESSAQEIRFLKADVMQLPFDVSTFNASSIAFGIRNVQDPMKALIELARVVRPGGVVMILEFGQPSMPGFREIFTLYSRHVLPRIGGMITGRKNAYEYLQNSSSTFPCGKEFLEMMRSTGRFTACDYRSLSFGIAYMYKAVVK